MSRKTRSIEIDEDLAFQRKEWFWQRAGIALLSVFVLGALLGLTGAGGVLSHAEAGDPAGHVRVEYERFVRRGSDSEIRLHLHSDPPGFVQVWVAAPYLDRVRIGAVAPVPQSVTVEQSRHVYTFRAASTDITIAIAVDHTSGGRLDGEVGIVNGPAVRFTQYSLF